MKRADPPRDDDCNDDELAKGVAEAFNKLQLQKLLAVLRRCVGLQVMGVGKEGTEGVMGFSRISGGAGPPAGPMPSATIDQPCVTEECRELYNDDEAHRRFRASSISRAEMSSMFMGRRSVVALTPIVVKQCRSHSLPELRRPPRCSDCGKLVRERLEGTRDTCCECDGI